LNVAVIDTRGDVKLLDFGIAKNLHSEASGERTQTTARQFSLHYASPEHVQGKAVGVASDVYALGCLFYELLTGQAPLALDNLSWYDVLERLQHSIPVEPSRIAQSHDQALKISHDVDRMCLHALKKHPHERYASVEQFHTDIVRFLRNEPISLRASFVSYRALKFVERNRIPVALAAVLALALIGGAIAMWQQQ
jgi:eukaryotic-like serine/threonine-protein kinase